MEFNSKEKRAPTPELALIQRPLFGGQPLLFRCSGSSVPCIRSPASAGHLVVHFVTGQMVGDRWFPGATILGAICSTTSANHPVSVPPTGPELPERFLLFWDFGSLYQRRCGVVSDALSRQPSSSSTSLRRLRLGVAAQASGTSHPRCFRFSRRCGVAHLTQGSGCEINAYYMQGSGCDINASHTWGRGCDVNASLTISRHQHVMARPRA